MTSSVKIPLHMLSVLNLFTEVVLGYVFWTLFEALAPMIWFYPLNELDITGYEAVAIAFCSPFVLTIPAIKHISQTWLGMSFLRLVAVLSIGSFQAPTTLLRLAILAVGVAAIMIVFTNSLWHKNTNYRQLVFWGVTLGKLLHVSCRVWFTSFVPTWWDNTSNTVVLTVALAATIQKIASGHDALESSETEERSECGLSSVCSGLALGSVLYLLSCVFGDVSIVSRWTVAGYPDPGPAPYPWGAVVLVALFLGVFMSKYRLPCGPLSTFLCWGLLTAGVGALYWMNTWVAFAGGVLLATQVTFLWRSVVTMATLCPPGATMGVTATVYFLQVLFSVWTIAYNFVPGGVYTREHTDWLLVYGVVAIACGLSQVTRIHIKPTATTVNSASDLRGVQTDKKSVEIVLMLLLLFGLSGFAARYHNQHISHPAKQHPNAEFVSAIWTYHFGYDNKGWPSLERTAEIFENIDADVITLLESDASKPFLGNNDLGMWLGERLGMYVDFGPSTRDHTWGNLILSRYPFVRSRHLLLPSPHGELAPAVVATVNMSGLLVDFVVTHMGNDRDRLDRKLQAEVLAKELRQAGNPVVFLGYVTSAPTSNEYRVLRDMGNVKDIDSTDNDRWCEYIMYRGLIRLAYARLSHGGLSDTEIQMARFRILQDQANFKDYDLLVTDENKVRVEYHFSPVYGKYREGHNYMNNINRYHMSTPKYFLP